MAKLREANRYRRWRNVVTALALVGLLLVYSRSGVEGVAWYALAFGAGFAWCGLDILKWKPELVREWKERRG